jgi:putative hydrolase of the HAD superfamily
MVPVMKPPVRAVLFDLGNTLAAYYYAEEFRGVLERGLRNVLDELQRRGRPGCDFDAALAAALQLNQEPKDLRVRPLAGRLATVFDITEEADGELLDALSARFLEPVFALGRRYDDALPALNHLRAAGIRTGIVSNSPWGSPPSLWRAELRRLELLDAVDINLFCGDVGWRKPAKAIFDRAAELIGVPPAECCFVGDDLRWDFEGATAAGMHPILLDRDGRHTAHAATSARELREVLQRLALSR